MKATRIISLLVAAFLIALSPVAAQAYVPDNAGVSNSGSEPTGNGCYATTFTVQGAPNDEITFELTNSRGDVVDTQVKTANAQGIARFRVEQCTPGTYTGTAYASDGSVLGSVQFVVPARGSDDDGGNDSNGSGSLPSTGSTTQDMLALGGGLALLVAGGIALVAVRRRSNA